MHQPECFCIDCEDRRRAAGLWCHLVTRWDSPGKPDEINSGLELLRDIGTMVRAWRGMGGRTKALQADLERAEGQRSLADRRDGR